MMNYSYRLRKASHIVPKVRSVSFHRHAIDIDTIEPCVCVIGVGFVGEALLREFGRKFRSIGFDISQERIDELQKSFRSFSKVDLTTDKTRLSQGTHYLISVPTGLQKDHSVNMVHLVTAMNTVLNYARPGSVVVIESSVCVGTTRQLLSACKEIYHCGMSPERVEPGRMEPAAREIPKLVSGLTPDALTYIHRLYGSVYNQVVPVSSTETAEMTKLFENCQRMINIAYVNEMADAARTHGVDPNEMIRAASSKPYGFTPYTPSLGVGGTCIPVNPHYLFANNRNLPVLEKATHQMGKRPNIKARRFHTSIISSLSGRSPKMLVVGIGYKPGQCLLSGSPGLAFAERLRRLGCHRLTFYDPLVPGDAVEWMEKLDVTLWHSSYLEANFDAVAICMRQAQVDFKVIEKLRGKIVVQEFT